MRQYFTSGLFCLQRKHLAYEYFLTVCFSRGGVVSAPPAGGPPLSPVRACLFNFFPATPPYRRPFLHPQPEDAPCRGDRDPQTRCKPCLAQIFRYHARPTVKVRLAYARRLLYISPCHEQRTHFRVMSKAGNVNEYI